MFRFSIAVVAGALLCAFPMRAQAEEHTPEHHAAALELMESMKIRTLLDDAVNKMLDGQIRQNPQIARFKPIMTEFFKKYMSWDAIKEDMANLYCDEFSADELKQLTAFYKTPIGQKLADKQPVLMAKSGELGQKRVQAHIGELQQAIQAEMMKGATTTTAPAKKN
ncbi:MAG TPA: DUF2059 domain-containing protein [Tepidisphaeraceae bacterium]|nr:DUF2059 domain-containing protein [Tepidisphaeraceae bacterium]